MLNSYCGAGGAVTCFVTFKRATENQFRASRYVTDRIYTSGSLDKDLIGSDSFQTVSNKQMGDTGFLLISPEEAIKTFLISEEHCIKTHRCSGKEEGSYLSHAASQVPLSVNIERLCDVRSLPLATSSQERRWRRHLTIACEVRTKHDKSVLQMTLWDH
jgi:hypothetical protein